MKKIRLSDCGILPDTDVTLALCELFKNNARDTEFIFENADYYFNPHEEMRYDYLSRKIAIQNLEWLRTWIH